MTYKLHEEFSITDFDGGPMKPKGWAIHWWGDPAFKPTFWNIVKLLIARAHAKSASVNFVSEAGLVACLISPFTVAWAQGDGGTGWGNNNLVSVENNPRCSAADRETLAELIADQNILNGIPIVLYPHNDFTATQCPGVWEQWIPSITARAKQIVAEKRGAKPAPAPVNPASSAPPKKPAPAPAKKQKTYPLTDIHWIVTKGDTLSKIQAYYNGPSVAQIATYNNIDPNRITPGQRIWIPGPLVWNIEAPDTIRSVANYYGLDAGYLARLNGLPGPDAEIYIGNVLTIKK